MDETKRPAPAELVEQYRQQMLQMYRQQTPPSPAEETNWLDERYPLPDIGQDMAAQAPPEPMPPTPAIPQTPTFPYTDEDLNGRLPLPDDTPSPPAVGESPFVGYLRVFVFTANGAEPLQGARVTVSRQEGDTTVLYANAETNIDGFTPVVPLPSVNPALTMQPDIPQPFVTYDIAVTADGFRSVRHENVPVYGNNYVTQPVSLVPLLPGAADDNTQIFQSGGPADL